MVMDMSSTIPAGRFKNGCLAILDEVARTGKPVIVTKRGRPVAKIVPIEEPKPVEGSVVHCKDIISPAIDPSDWNMGGSGS